MPSTLGIVASTWSPAKLSPALWLDAADTTTITESSGSVSQWSDKSGNGLNVAQSVGTDQPTTGTRTQNGRNVIDFDGTSDRLSSEFDLSSLTSNKAFTLLVVVKSDTTGSGRAFVAAGRFTNQFDLASGFQLNHGTGANSLAFIGDGSTGVTAPNFRDLNVEAQTTNPALFTVQAEASSNTFTTRFNGDAGLDTLGAGTLAASNFLTTGSANHRINVGARMGFTFGNFLDGWVGEVVLITRLISDSERTLLTDYLNAKWAVY